EGKPDVHVDHFAVLAEGSVDELVPEPPLAEGAEVELKLVEIGRYDAGAGVGRHEGHAVIVAGAASQVGKKVKARITRTVDGAVYATLADAPRVEAPLTAEAEAEKPTRKPPARKAAAAVEEAEAPLELEEADEEAEEEEDEDVDGDAEPVEGEADGEVEPVEGEADGE